MTSALSNRLDRIENLLSDNSQRADSPFTVRQAAAYLDVSTSYLYKLTSQQLIPHYKPTGKRLYFRRSDLDAFLFNKRIRTRTEIETDAANRVAHIS